MNNKNIINKIQESEQIISMIMGILVVLAIGGLVYRYFQKQQPDYQEQTQEQQEETSNQEKQEEQIQQNEGLPTTHSVAVGENLWQIAEIYYSSGYNWVDIAQENGLSNPNLLNVGQKLTIPDVASRKITAKTLPETGIGSEIQADTYTVKEADSLSKIAGRAYGDIYSWPKIWAANRDLINNPNLIETGMVLEIPRD